MTPLSPSPARTVPPGPPDSHEIGTTDTTIDLLQRWFSEYGDTYRVFSTDRDAWTWVIHHPVDVKRVFVVNHRNYTKGVGIDRVRLLLGNGIMTSEGEFWRRQRRMVQPAFHRAVIEQFVTVIRRQNAVMFERWSAAAASGEPLNLSRSLSELTLGVVLEAIFGDDLGRLVQDLDDNPFMIVARETRRDPQFAYRFRQLGTVVRRIIRHRRAAGRRGFDFVQMLMQSRDPDTGQGMSEEELVDEILTLVVAGHETTASALSWTWWLISQHPEVETRIHDEQPSTAGLGVERYADIDRRPYLHAVLQEAMRLYPPGWLLTRRTIGPDRLGGYAVPPGTDVFVSPYLIHRHPDFWQDPERFDPGRFLPPRAAGHDKFAYIPFAAGPRHCVGQNLAIFEMLLHLEGATRGYRLRAIEPGPVAVEARINLRPARDLYMRVEQR
jgi:cytochrome P450